MFFTNLVSFMSAGAVVALVLAKKDAIQEWRKLMGPTNPAEAKETFPDSIRALFGKGIVTTLKGHNFQSKLKITRETPSTARIPCWAVNARFRSSSPKWSSPGIRRARNTWSSMWCRRWMPRWRNWRRRSPSVPSSGSPHISRRTTRTSPMLNLFDKKILAIYIYSLFLQ